MGVREAEHAMKNVCITERKLQEKEGEEGGRYNLRRINSKVDDTERRLQARR